MKPKSQLDGNVVRRKAATETQTSLVSTSIEDFARVGYARIRSSKLGWLGIGSATQGEAGDCVGGGDGWYGNTVEPQYPFPRRHKGA